MKIVSEQTEVEIVDRTTVIIAEYYPQDAKNYLKKYTDKGWKIVDSRFHCMNTSKFTLQRVRPVDNTCEQRTEV